MKLQSKIAFMIIGFGSLLLVAVSSLYFVYYRSHNINELRKQLLNIAVEGAARGSGYLKERAAIALSLAKAPVIIDVLEKSNLTPSAGTGKGKFHAHPRVSPDTEAARYLKKIVTSLPAAFDALYLYDRYGRVVAASGELSSLLFYYDFSWTSSLAEGKGKIFFDIFDSTGVQMKDTVGIVLPLVKNSEIIGFLRGAFNISEALTELEGSGGLGKGDELKIINSQGIVVFEKDSSEQHGKDFSQLVNKMKKGKAGLIPFKGGDESRLMAYAPLSAASGAWEYRYGKNGGQWHIIVTRNLNDALSPLPTHVLNAFLIGLLTLLLLGGLSIVWSRSLALPVKGMEKLLKRVGRGDFDVSMDRTSWDELSTLANCFNEMVHNLRHKTLSRDLLAKEMCEQREREEKGSSEEHNYRELWQQFEAILHAMTDSLVLLTPEREVIWSNKKGKQAAGQKCYTLWRASSEFCRECPPLKSFEEGMSEECRITTDDGRVWDVRSFPIRDANNKVSKVIEVASDITEKVRLREEVIRAGQLASVGELAASVAHEINNPINGIINLAQLLVDENSSDDKNREIYDWIISEGNRITVIVNELLSFARKRKGEKKKLIIDEIITNSLTLTKAQMEKEGISIKINLSPNLPELVAHEGQLKQVMLNIINNARYALNDKYEGWDKNKVLEISVEKVNIKDSPFMRIIFHDRGKGIPANLQAKIGNPFFTTKPEGEGTGLGLSISFGIVKDHGGRILFDSMEGEFTRVAVELPIK